MEVELKYAGIPLIGMVAVHYWFVTNTFEERVRWEVWQQPDVGAVSKGHLHRNLMAPDAPVGKSPTRLAYCWSDEVAERLRGVLERSWNEYPYHNQYCALLGPNSNTFVTWVLHQASIPYRLSWKGHGRSFKF